MDRFTFLARYSLPASHAVAALRAARGVARRAPRIHLWREGAASVYDSAAFDPMAYAARVRVVRPGAGDQIIALGARLFADPRLSGPGTRGRARRATCPARAFTDGLPKRASLVPDRRRSRRHPPARHTPTLINAALQPALFDDERARAPEQQIAQVLANADEMGSSTDTAVRRVAADSGLPGGVCQRVRRAAGPRRHRHHAPRRAGELRALAGRAQLAVRSRGAWRQRGDERRGPARVHGVHG